MYEEDVYFSFDKYANSLAELIAEQDRESSFVIALTGSWGCGKTTLMNLTLEKLNDDEFIKTTFNAWRYTKEDAFWRGFFINIIESIRKHISNNNLAERMSISAEERVTLNELFDDTERSLYTAFTKETPGDITIDTGSLAKTSIKLALKFFPLGDFGSEWIGKIFQDSKKEANTLTDSDVQQILGFFKRSIIKQQTEKLTSMEQFRLSMERLLSAVLCRTVNNKTGTSEARNSFKLVVAIDDLDRCLPEQALDVLEAIKLFLDLPMANFVVALDQDIIQHALDIRYEQGKLARPQITANNYTEKMIDLSFSIPSQLESNFSKYIENELPNGKLLMSIFSTLRIALPINLRTWKRYADKANFNKKILEKVYRDNNINPSILFDEKEFNDFYFKIQCLSYKWPELFKNIANFKTYIELERCINEAEVQKDAIDKNISKNIIMSASNTDLVPTHVWDKIEDVNLLKFIVARPQIGEKIKKWPVDAIFSLDS